MGTIVTLVLYIAGFLATARWFVREAPDMFLTFWGTVISAMMVLCWPAWWPVAFIYWWRRLRATRP